MNTLLAISRRLALCATIVAILGCGGSSSPSEPSSCTNVAGAYRASFSNSCGGSFSNQPVTVAQAGCSFTAVVSGETITGTISGNSANFSIVEAPPCSGTATGTATITSSAIVGTFSGTVTTSGQGCCPLGPVSGSFTLTK